MIFSVIPFLVIAYFSHNIVNSFTTYFTDYSNLYVKFISSGILYTLLMSVIIIFFPLIMGLNRQDIKSVFQNLGIKS